MQLFLAFPIDPILSFRLLAMADDVPDAKWRTEAQLHLTVQFFGDITPDLAQKLDQKLAAIPLPPLSLNVGGVGLLGRFGRPSLHAVIHHDEGLETLRKKVINIARSLDIRLAKERFIPHITLCYLPVEFNRDKTHEWLRRYHHFESPMQVNQLNLYESIQTKYTTAYDVRATYPIP